MDKIPAACAMDWSIELDKSLRSKKPGKSIEAIKEIGSRLEWWNRDSKLTVAEYKIFGLIPGEDKLFLNAIFLRLVDAFRLGDKDIKSCIIKIFLSLRRKRRRSSVKDADCGILSKGKLENCMEFLRRVKVVFDTGDVEERAMALVLFGCWADFAKDVADIRYIVLSSLVSDDAYEVKASLFAAGCFCELSDDFSNVFLEILTRMVISLEIPRDVRLAGVRAFAKLWCPLSLADKAYKTGLKLLKDSSEDDFSSVMLISLSKIASKWTLLISAQIELLTLFVSEERSLDFQATTLRCLNFTLAKGVCDFPSATDIVHKLLSIMNRSEISLALQFEALEILRKILLYGSPIIPCMEMLEIFPNLLTVVENMVRSSSKSKRVLAFRVLVDISGKILGRADMVSSEIGSTLASQVISFVLDRTFLLVRSEVDGHQPDLDMELEVKSSLNLLVNMVENHSYLRCLVLNKICIFIDNLIKELDRVVRIEKTDLPSHDITESIGGSKTLFNSKLMLYVSKVVVVCIQNLDESDAGKSQVFGGLMHHVEHVRQCTSFDNYIHTIYCLLLHFCAIHSCMCSEKQEVASLDKNFTLSCVDSIIQLDNLTLDCAKKMLGAKSYWTSYKAGKLAVYQGAWSTAAFIFEHIHTTVQSTSCSHWLKSLAQFSHSEKQTQSFFIPNQGTSILNHSTIKGDPFVPSELNVGKREGIFWKINQCNYIENLISACSSLCSAEETLGDSGMGLLFGFQRWFLSLRAKLLASVVDIMKLLNTTSLVQYSNSPAGQGERTVPVSGLSFLQRLSSLVDSFTEVSRRMNKLTREFDLFVTSFIGMDRQSAIIVSTLALSCSLMAFSSGFVFLIPKLQYSENYKTFNSECLEEPFHGLLLEDLVGRLRQIVSATRTSILFLMKSFGKSKSCFSPRLRNQISDSYETRFMLKLCDHAIVRIVALQNEASRIQGGEGMSQTINDGSQLLLNIISQCILIPFRTPKHFFQVRPHVTSELFVMNEDGKHVDGVSVFSGSPLSLSLCLQLRNMPAGPPFRLTKLFCILNCRTSSQITTEMGENKRQTHLGSQDLVDLNEQLVGYVTGSTRSCRMHCGDNIGDCIVNQYVHFELNARGQGFSTCLLDVSSFPVGSYRIKWHSCCIDSGGSYWSLLPLNAGPVLTIQDSKIVR
ncbi:ARM repeat superfamily protein [Forsythia ovata]|uniref:ARM repeat superfamily protein n=1 Tax=Forsythia ovata TaxID=205694 RepID=A0ABD1VJ36_9LAMI